LRHHESEIQSDGVKTLFDTETYKSEVLIYGQGNTDIKPVHYEFWLWQLVLSLPYLNKHFVIN